MTICLVVEDEPLAREKVCALIRETPWIHAILEADTVASARSLIRQNQIAIAFLDVRLPDGRSLPLLDELPDDTIVVFTTAFDEYAVTAFELQALDYLVKPFSEQRFRATLERVHRAVPAARVEQRARASAAEAQGPPRRIFARTGRSVMPLDVERVDRIEGHDDHAAVWLDGHRHLVFRRLKDLETILAPAGFVRVHRSCLVNMHRVADMKSLGDGRMSIRLSSGETVIASRAGATALRRRMRL